MKKLILLTALLLTVIFSYAQFGGGSGTIFDPYKIYTKLQFEELADSVLNGNTYIGEHFILMNNIEDSVKVPVSANSFSFNGFFHGKGYNMTLAIDLRGSSIDYGSYSLFPNIGAGGTIDSLSVTGYLYAVNGIVGYNYGTISNIVNNLTVPYTQNEFSEYVELMGGSIFGSGICSQNYGTIENCTNYCEIHGNYLGGICSSNFGAMQNCINNGTLILHNNSIQYDCSGGGISFENANEGLIDYCKNFADILFTSNLDVLCIGGIVGNNSANIINCINAGNISGKVQELGGCIGCFYGGKILNCSNFGNLSGNIMISGICGLGDFCFMKNCFNSGNISGDSLVGGISAYTYISDTISSCLNIGRTNGAAVLDFFYESPTQPSELSFNYYDKQMCISKGIADVDVPDSAEGKLTTQLIGTSPALQAMLGDGWSYAEGRYPIPLGLENDSMALVAATPVYLHFETEEDFNHVDSVSRNFTVGLENNVSWEEANGRVSFSGENVTLLNIGMETITVNLGDYSKKVRINILDTETSNILETITEKGIIIYPNPASDYININLNGISADKIEFCDITGKVILSQIIAKEHNQIHIGDLKPGMYLLKIYNKNQNVTTLRFVKN